MRIPLLEPVARLDLVQGLAGQQGEGPWPVVESVHWARTGQARQSFLANWIWMQSCPPMRSGRHARLTAPCGQVACRMSQSMVKAVLFEALSGLGLVAVVGGDRTEQGDAVHLLPVVC
ncbi:hypothetical protein GCM10010365_72730 [Streptomyces poonensis]|uniref:Uncharacterized protein n=1 Tax=Streptomyces poonensis TaxID=68255 RepID=A0A918UY79_9ACTN|nr:hypothetical protein GCM10010365_72730 [Streptomyces poonensis]